MYVTFKDKRCDLYADNGKIIRRFNAKANIVNAMVNGSGETATIAITDKMGHTSFYNTRGQIIRRK